MIPKLEGMEIFFYDWCSNSGVAEGASLVGCGDVLFLCSEGVTSLQNVVNCLSTFRALHP